MSSAAGLAAPSVTMRGRYFRWPPAVGAVARCVPAAHTSIFIPTQSNLLHYTQPPQLEFYFLLYLQKVQMNGEHAGY